MPNIYAVLLYKLFLLLIKKQEKNTKRPIKIIELVLWKKLRENIVKYRRKELKAKKTFY